MAANPKHLGAALGFLGVLHTWTRQLEYHPHIHYLVPGRGLTEVVPAGGGLRVIRSSENGCGPCGSPSGWRVIEPYSIPLRLMNSLDA